MNRIRKLDRSQFDKLMTLSDLRTALQMVHPVSPQTARRIVRAYLALQLALAQRERDERVDLKSICVPLKSAV